jgi:filamentous hemagglutinin
MDALDADVPGAGHNGGPPLGKDPPGTIRVPVPMWAVAAAALVNAMQSLTTPSAAQSLYDTSITNPGSVLNVQTNVTAQDFQSTLIDNGYYVTRQDIGTNGSFTVMSNGSGSTYTIYTRTSTAQVGAQYLGPTGTSTKFNLVP